MNKQNRPTPETAIPDYTFSSIGVVHTAAVKQYDAPRQPSISEFEAVSTSATIELFPYQNYEQALADIDGFERIWVVWVFHTALGTWKPKVSPPRGGGKRGVFATRSPHRPNPLGLSCVRLLAVRGRFIDIDSCDMIAGTPILDIKPYIPSYDAHPHSTAGWVDALEARTYQLVYTPTALERIQWIYEKTTLDIQRNLSRNLSAQYQPNHTNRIRSIDSHQGLFCISIQQWRVIFLQPLDSTSSIEIRTVLTDAQYKSAQGTLLSSTPVSPQSIDAEFAQVFPLCSVI